MLLTYKIRFTTGNMILQNRALCRMKLFSVTHVLVDTWMLTVKQVYKLSNVPDDLKWATNTQHDTMYAHFQGTTNNIYGFGRPFLLLCFTRRPTFLPSVVFTRPNDGWMGLYINLCCKRRLYYIAKM